MDKTNYNFGTMLSREEAKAINAGYGTGSCQLFCCTGPNTCPGEQIPVTESVSCNSDMECRGLSSEFTCTTPGAIAVGVCIR